MSSEPQTSGPSPENSESQQELEQLRAKVAELEGMRERFVRSAADFENAKKRLARDKEEFVKYSQETLLRDLLPVLDNFERALAHIPAGADGPAKAVLTGVQMVFKQMTEILKSQGLKRIVSIGEDFDPHKHEAVGYVHDKGKENVVVEEVEPGYSLHDRLLRAAKVRVRGASPQNQNAEEEKQDNLT